MLGNGSLIVACEHGSSLYSWRVRLQIYSPAVGTFAFDENVEASLEFGGGDLGEEIFHYHSAKKGRVVLEEYLPNGSVKGHFEADRFSGAYVISGSFSLPITPL